MISFSAAILERTKMSRNIKDTGVDESEKKSDESESATSTLQKWSEIRWLASPKHNFFYFYQ